MRVKLLLVILVAAMLCTGLAAMAQHPARAHAIPPPESRVDINLASKEELLMVPGLTRTWAERIIRFRPYRAKNELLDRGVLPGQVYDRIKDYVIAHQQKP